MFLYNERSAENLQVFCLVFFFLTACFADFYAIILDKAVETIYLIILHSVDLLLLEKKQQTNKGKRYMLLNIE